MRTTEPMYSFWKNHLTNLLISTSSVVLVRLFSHSFSWPLCSPWCNPEVDIQLLNTCHLSRAFAARREHVHEIPTRNTKKQHGWRIMLKGTPHMSINSHKSHLAKPGTHIAGTFAVTWYEQTHRSRPFDAKISFHSINRIKRNGSQKCKNTNKWVMSWASLMVYLG